MLKLVKKSVLNMQLNLDKLEEFIKIEVPPLKPPSYWEMFKNSAIGPRTVIEFSKDFFFQRFSPWTLANEINRQIENGDAPPPIISRKICDLGQFSYEKTYWGMLLATGSLRRTVHVITNPELIKEGLKIPRNGQIFKPYPTIVDEHIQNSQNMLTCPAVEHRKLRQPYERVFSREGVEKEFLFEFTQKLIYSGKSNTRDPLDLILNQLNTPTLTHEERSFNREALLTASTHTTTLTHQLSKTLLEAFPEWREKIIQEWTEAFGELDIKYYDETLNKEGPEKRIITFVQGGQWGEKMITPSPSLHLFLLEVLRLYPVVPYIVRIANQDLKLGGETIKKGDAVVLNILGYQRGKTFGENPMDFNPERFINNGKAPNILKNNLSILNFSAGPEHCIGKNFARYALLISTIVDAIHITLRDSKIPAATYLIGTRDYERSDENAQLADWTLHQLPPYKIDGPFLRADGELI